MSDSYTKPDMLKAALDYAAQGLAVFPVNSRKVPLTNNGFYNATQSGKTITEWWTQWPDAGIAIPTAGLVVVDVDIEKGGLESWAEIQEAYGDLPQTRIHQTGSGGYHYVYKNPDVRHIGNKTRLAGLNGLDIRANGGYIVMPPSKHETGCRYEAINNLPIALAPNWLINLIVMPPEPQAEVQEGGIISEGRRNSTLTSFAGSMRRRGMPQVAIKAALLEVNRSQCQPPLEERAIKKIASSVSRYAPNAGGDGDKDNYNTLNSTVQTGNVRKTLWNSLENEPNGGSSVRDDNKSLAQRVRDWVGQTTGWFTTEELDSEIGIKTSGDKANRRFILHTLKSEGVIEAHLKQNRLFRRIDKDLRLIDFKKTGRREPLDLKLPFNLSKMVNVYPRNIIVIAGASDSGKTAWMLNFIKDNQDNFSIYYYSSEMGEAELANRLSKFDSMTLNDWNFRAEERSANFADVIRPDDINLIDFLEISSDFSEIAEQIRNIHDRLGTGICIIAIQKNKGVDLGRGGSFSLEKARLYLSMDAGITTVIKAKNWASPDKNPNRLKICYKIVKGCEFIVTKDWHQAGD